MARLIRGNPPGDWGIDFKKDVVAEIHRTDRLLDALYRRQPKSADASYRGAVLSFGVADGKAFYIVVKDKPLTLMHIPYGDAWTVCRCTMNGIDRQEVEYQLERHEFWTKMETKHARR